MSGGSSKKSQEPAYNIPELQAAYKNWQTEAEKRRGKSTTSAISRMAASGLRPGSELWKKNIGAIETEFEREMSEIEATETARVLREDVAKKKAEATRRERNKKLDPRGGDFGGENEYGGGARGGDFGFNSGGGGEWGR